MTKYHKKLDEIYEMMLGSSFAKVLEKALPFSKAPWWTRSWHRCPPPWAPRRAFESDLGCPTLARRKRKRAPKAAPRVSRASQGAAARGVAGKEGQEAGMASKGTKASEDMPCGGRQGTQTFTTV